MYSRQTLVTMMAVHSSCHFGAILRGFYLLSFSRHQILLPKCTFALAYDVKGSWQSITILLPGRENGWHISLRRRQNKSKHFWKKKSITLIHFLMHNVDFYLPSPNHLNSSLWVSLLNAIAVEKHYSDTITLPIILLVQKPKFTPVSVSAAEPFTTLCCPRYMESILLYI